MEDKLLDEKEKELDDLIDEFRELNRKVRAEYKTLTEAKQQCTIMYKQLSDLDDAIKSGDKT